MIFSSLFFRHVNGRTVKGKIATLDINNLTSIFLIIQDLSHFSVAYMILIFDQNN